MTGRRGRPEGPALLEVTIPRAPCPGCGRFDAYRITRTISVGDGAVLQYARCSCSLGTFRISMDPDLYDPGLYGT